MDPFVLILVLAAAVFHATWNTLVKSGGDPLTTAALLNLTSLCIGIVLLPWVGLPPPAAWPYLLATAVIHVAYFALLVAAYNVGDLGHVYPLARGSGPVYAAIFAYVFAGETLSPWGIAAIALICAAIVSLAFAGGGRLRFLPTVLALANGLTIGGYTIVDGMGARVSESPLGFVAWIFLLQGPVIVAFAAWRRRDRLGATLARTWRTGVLGGALSFAAYALVLWAMTLSPIAFVSALRETSVVIAAAIGTFVLKEPLGRLRIAAAATVTLGIVILQASG
jgi:drug/metabolite transporter (DMT)-like permease